MIETATDLFFSENAQACFLTILSIILSAMLILSFTKRINIIRCTIIALSTTVIGYMLSTVPLLCLEWFSVKKTLALEDLLLFLLLLTRIVILKRKGDDPLFGEIEWNIRKQIVLVILIIIGLILSWNNFGFFGMGQDEGVYQIRAIDLMNGQSSRVYHFNEYASLEREDDRTDYYYAAIESLTGGLYNRIMTKEYNESTPSFLEPDRNTNDPDQAADAIYHGIPTYPAMLALWGTLFGMESMMGIQTLLFLLTIGILWFVAEELELKRSVSVFVCLIYLLSPEILWLSKSSLTECFTGLLIAVFMFFLLNRKHPQYRWWSALSVVAFAFFHASIYAMIPMFFALYILLYLWNGEKQYLRALMIAATGFIAGISFMVYISPEYTISNTKNIWIGFITLDNVYYVFITGAVAALFLALVLYRVRVTDSFQKWIHSRPFGWILRGIILLLSGIIAYSMIQRISISGNVTETIITTGLYNVIWMTGILSIPVILVSVLHKPRKWLQNERYAAVLLLFIYAVLLFCSILKPTVSGCYYMGRYYGPYIPVVCIMAGLVWNNFSRRTVCFCTVLSVMACLPFDAVMINTQDDTRCSFEALTRLSEVANSGNSALLIDPRTEETQLFFLPLRTLTGRDCYFTQSDPDSQISKLKTEYDRIYYVTSKDLDYPLLTKIVEFVSQDDDVSNRCVLCPFPFQFLQSQRSVSVYCICSESVFTDQQLFITGNAEYSQDCFILNNGGIQFGPYIEMAAGKYRIKVSGKNLDDAVPTATANRGGADLPVSIVHRDSDSIIYDMVLPEPMKDVEFLTVNRADAPVIISQITVKEVQPDIFQITEWINSIPGGKTVYVHSEHRAELQQIAEGCSEINVFSKSDIQPTQCDYIVTHTPFDLDISRNEYRMIGKNRGFVVYAKNTLLTGNDKVQFKGSDTISLSMTMETGRENMSQWVGFTPWNNNSRWMDREDAEIRIAGLDSEDYKVTIIPGELPDNREPLNIRVGMNGHVVIETTVAAADSKADNPEEAQRRLEPIEFTVTADMLNQTGYTDTLTITSNLWNPRKRYGPYLLSYGLSIRSIVFQKLEE